MSVNPISAVTPSIPAAATTSPSSNSTDTTAMFMKLLTAELKSQDPTQTMDPTTIVTQMVQINQLSDVAGIYSILQQQGSQKTSGSAKATLQSVHNPLGEN